MGNTKDYNGIKILSLKGNFVIFGTFRLEGQCSLMQEDAVHICMLFH